MPYVCSNRECIQAYFYEYQDKVVQRAKRETKRARKEQERAKTKKIRVFS